jgi:hypothetical protein
MSDFIASVFGIGIMLTSFAAWITHLIHCFTNEAWGLLIGGAIFFPVAIVNGIGLWFGWW